MNFITSKPLEVPILEPLEGNEAGNMMVRGSGWSGEIHTPPTAYAERPLAAREPDSKREGDSHKQPKESTTYGDLKATPGAQGTRSKNAADRLDDPLRKTRMAIRRQLRYLFIYPLVYIVMWSFPFASHALNYSEYYVQHPVFWLSVVQTMMLSLQAGVDSIMFSCSEKPWGKVDASKFSISFFWRWSKAFLQRRSFQKSSVSSVGQPAQQQPVNNHNPTWWEAEGRRRNDSVWLGTNTISHTISSLATRTRSRSPRKQRQGLNSRPGSCEQGTVVVPRLEPVSAGTGTLSLDQNAPEEHSAGSASKYQS
ncbi:hypothetical protein A1O7_08179 [Cladophialophora yegresii CBS 114405]|uniref:G protein-coupled receptor GPR1/2/3 C-terminal domain-containing protein n=1 Tax=Cladophialophora yegresii CBS 114405 TaxID=1182544 RepID=W9VIB4_9EURO|nr:uncharacterized protein A1O7_08179 [Cladophialophora yegresii CBS 114405]EXJ55253.1 hypothetical protein A1O7_08179 [Cladophialophora yegresii CBS 114405]